MIWIAELSKSIMTDTKAKLPTEIKQANLINIMISSNRNFLYRGANIRAVYEFILSERDPDIGTYSNFNKYIKSKGLKSVKTVVGVRI